MSVLYYFLATVPPRASDSGWSALGVFALFVASIAWDALAIWGIVNLWRALDPPLPPSQGTR